jgi:hypothetical protein
MSSSKLQDDISMYRHRNHIIQLKLDDFNVLIKQERSHIQLSSQHLSGLFKKPREGLTTLEEICIGNEIKMCRQNNVSSFRKINDMRQEVKVLKSILNCNEDYISKMERELKSTPLIFSVEDHEDFVFPDGYWTI